MTLGIVAQVKLKEHINLYWSEGLCFFAIPFGIKGDSSTPWATWQTRRPTLQEVRAMFGDGHPHNIAIPGGPVSDNITFIDMDDEPIWAAYQEHFKTQTGKSIQEVTRISHGKRGGVVWVKTEESVRSVKFPGGEIRNFGNYQVAPPSLHPDGIFYKIVNPGVPILKTHNLRDIFIDIPTSQNTPAPQITGDILEGNRDQTLTSLAGSMRHRGLSEPVILAALLETNKKLCKPPLAESSVYKIAKSIGRYPSSIKAEAVHGFRGGVPT